jgi:hypothetical protein
MRIKRFAILLLATIVAVATAAVLAMQQSGPATIAGAGEPVLPGLLEDANRIDRIVLKSGETTLTLAQTEDAWVIKERSGYPASFEKIKALVVGLAQLRRIEPKTERPERYAQIGVEDAGPGATSTEVSLFDREGVPVGRLIVGEDSLSGGTGGRYVRIPEEARAWLAAGTLDLSLTARDWAAPEVIDIPGADVREVVIRRPNGERIIAARADPSEPHLSLRTIPSGARPKSPDIADGFAGALTAVEFDDVKPVADVAFSPGDTTHVRIETFDGLIIDADLLDRDETNWIRLMPSAADGASPETSAKAASLAERTHGWAYQVSSWRLSQLKRALDDLVEGEKPS